MRRSFSDRSFLLILLPLFVLSACQSKELTSAKIYMENQNWPKALQQLEAAVSAYPKNAEAHFLLGQAYGVYGRYEDMIQEFETSARLSDKFRPLIAAHREQYWTEKYNAGLKAQSEENYQRAEKDLKTAIKLDPQKYEAHKKLAFNYLKSGELNRALLLYEELLRKNPADVDLLVSTANLYYSQKDYTRVVHILEKVLVLAPNHRDALANLALSYDSLNKREQAQKAFLKALDANPEDKDLFFLFGVHHYKRKNYEQAVQLFKRVLDLSPDDFESVTNIGNAYLSMAEDLKLKLKAAGNGTAESYDILKMKGQIVLYYKRAIPYLEKALQIQPTHQHLWQNLGISYINTGEAKKGEEAFWRSEKLQIEVMQ